MAGNFRVAIVDGTGALNDDKYNREMANSFCSQIARSFGLAGAPSDILSNDTCMYQRGPSMEGITTNTKAERSRDYLLAGRKAGNGTPNKLVLIGYSRGGAAAIRTAELLGRAGINVDAMFLFDPVARYIGRGGVVVPSNVQLLRIASRAFDDKSVAKYDGLVARGGKAAGKLVPTLAPLAVLPGGQAALVTAGALGAIGKLASDWVNPMRPGFGFAGTTFEGDQSKAERNSFAGSHGALGGVGYSDVTGDKDCQARVAEYMSKGLNTIGIRCFLTGGEPSDKWD